MAKSLIFFLSCCALLLWSNTRVLGDCGDCRIKTPRECFLDNLESQVGVREATGKNDGIEVEYYLSTVNLGKGFAWCGAFIYSQLKECISIVGKPSSFAWVPTWGKASNLTDNPIPGDLFLLYYASLKRAGHVGAIVEVRDNSYITIEGNTNEAGSREGQGVYRKIRLKRSVYKTVNWID